MKKFLEFEQHLSDIDGEIELLKNSSQKGADTLNKISNLQKDFESMVSLKTFVEKEDIANMAVFLLSDEANKISGQILTVDGNTERMN